MKSVSHSGSDRSISAAANKSSMSAAVGTTVVIGVPLAEVVKDITEKAKVKKLKNAKQFLSTMRNLVAYISLQRIELTEEVISNLLSISSEVTDQDSDRKIVRLMYALVTRYIQSCVARGYLLSPSLKHDVAIFLREEVKSQTGSRKCLAQRTQGSLCKYLDNSWEVASALLGAIKGLTYPSKGKGSLFGGQKKIEKEYDTAIGNWISLLSAMNRTNVNPTKEIQPILFTGSLSDNDQISRHSISLLGKLATDTIDLTSKDLTEISDHFLIVIKGVRDKLQTIEIFKCAAVIEAITKLINNPNFPIDKAATLLAATVPLGNHPSCKITADVVKCVFENERAWAVLRYQARSILPSNIAIVDILKPRLLMMQKKDVGFSVLLRACVRIGRFFVSRPKDSDYSNIDPIATLAPLWKACQSWYNIFVTATVTAAASSAASADVFASSSAAATAVGPSSSAVSSSSTSSSTQISASNTSSSASMAATSSASTATSINSNSSNNNDKNSAHCIAQMRPHLFAEIIKAIIWLTPDERHFGVAFGASFEQMWRELCNRLAKPLPSPLRLSALELLGMELTYPIVANIFARAALFMTVSCLPKPQSSNSRLTSAGTGSNADGITSPCKATNSLLDDLGMLDFSAAVPSAATTSSAAASPIDGVFGYSNVLVNLLLCVSEKQLALFPSIKTANALQQVWNFVALFTIPTITHNPFLQLLQQQQQVASSMASILAPSSSFASSTSPSASQYQYQYQSQSHPLIINKSSAQRHAQSALAQSLTHILEANIQPCKAFYRELNSNRVYVWDGANGSTANSSASASAAASTGVSNSSNYNNNSNSAALAQQAINASILQISIDLRCSAMWIIAEYAMIWFECDSDSKDAQNSKFLQMLLTLTQAAWTEIEVVRSAAIEGLIKIAVRLHQSATMLATSASQPLPTPIISKLVALKDIILVELCDLVSEAMGLDLTSSNSYSNSTVLISDWYYSSNIIKSDLIRCTSHAHLCDAKVGNNDSNSTMQSTEQQLLSTFVVNFEIFAINSIVSDLSFSGNECHLIYEAVRVLSSSNAIDFATDSMLTKLAGPFLLSCLCFLDDAAAVAVPYLQKSNLADTIKAIQQQQEKQQQHSKAESSSSTAAINVFDDDIAFLDFLGGGGGGVGGPSSSSTAVAGNGGGKQQDLLTSIWSDDLTAFLGVGGGSGIDTLAFTTTATTTTATTTSNSSNSNTVLGFDDWGLDLSAKSVKVSVPPPKVTSIGPAKSISFAVDPFNTSFSSPASAKKSDSSNINSINAFSSDPFASNSAAAGQSSFSSSDPFAASSDPFGSTSDGKVTGYAGSSPTKSVSFGDAFTTTASVANLSTNSFSSPGKAEGSVDSFGTAAPSSHPFHATAMIASSTDPFYATQTTAASTDPFFASSATVASSDPFQASSAFPPLSSAPAWAPTIPAASTDPFQATASTDPFKAPSSTDSFPTFPSTAVPATSTTPFPSTDPFFATSGPTPNSFSYGPSGAFSASAFPPHSSVDTFAPLSTDPFQPTSAAIPAGTGTIGAFGSTATAFSVVTTLSQNFAPSAVSGAWSAPPPTAIVDPFAPAPPSASGQGYGYGHHPQHGYLPPPPHANPPGHASFQVHPYPPNSHIPSYPGVQSQPFPIAPAADAFATDPFATTTSFPKPGESATPIGNPFSLI